MKRKTHSLWIVAALLIAVAVPSTLFAQVAPQYERTVAEKAFRHADLQAEESFSEVDRLPLKAANTAYQRLSALGIEPSTAILDVRTGRFASLFPTVALIPGDGVGNDLVWQKAAPQGDARTQAAWAAVQDYLRANQQALGIDFDELTTSPRSGSFDDGEMFFFHIRREFDGIPVRDSHANATIKKGNLILLGFQKWADRGASSNRPALSEEEATQAVRGHVAPLALGAGEGELVFLTLEAGNGNGNGQGFRYQLAWAVTSDIDGAPWETLVNAHDGSILAHTDLRHFAEAKGGVYPVSNDGNGADGTEQAGWPMPFAEVGSAVTTTGGNYSLSGSQTARLYGPYVNMADQCGTDSLTQSGGIDWGTSGGDDCTTPGIGGAGNTHASRTGFYELNKLKEMARGQLPSNTWLQNRLTSNMNINNTCNAFWNGSTVNFYRSGGGCTNTGEIAGVFDHEWGHGMDANDVVGGIASPSGEGIADIYTALRLSTSCIGRNFRLGTNCSGNGDPCLNCDGVRDIDYLKRQSGNPHDYSWSNANCGGSVHCVGGVYSEAVWSLWKRKLQQAPYNYDNNTAHEIVNRLTFIAAGNTSTWFSGGPPSGGCSSSSGYKNYLAADDDNGNLNDGTPHMTAIYQSFNDQEIACGTPTVQDSGCSGKPTSAPSVNTTPGDTQVSLSWAPVSGATQYEVFRTEGVAACDFGKVKIADSSSTSFTDTGLRNGRDYSYIVIAKSSSNACFGPATSCLTVQPSSGPQCSVNADCDDGLFCNGAETCSAGQCVSGSDPCTAGQTCNETTNACETPPPCSHSADFTSGTDGWTNGSDTCTTGSFVQGTPNEQIDGTVTTQVGGGNPGGAYYTQPNTALGTDDVDGGTCEGLSPVVDCSSVGSADISLDYFHGQRDAGDDSADGFTVEILNNGSVVQTLVNIGDVTSQAAWTNVSTTVSNPGNIQIRVRATDGTVGGDLVEAGIDNVSITAGAPQCTVNADCDDGLFCNGAETCSGGSCQAGSNPCSGGTVCNESTDACDPAPSCTDTVNDDFEAGAPDWSNDAASTCSTGAYVIGSPTNPSGGYQIASNHSGAQSIFSASNSSAGVDDIDGGNCILMSPSYSVDGDSTLSIWYWFGQRDAGDDPSGDWNRLEYSTNNGATWQTLASVGDVTVNPSWTNATAQIPGGSTVKVRMQCSDGTAGGDLVECGIDDISILCN